MPAKIFRFRRFSVRRERAGMKLTTDSVLLGAWAAAGAAALGPRKILDIGTGTGVIALIMAQRFPEAAVAAAEIDGGAAADAAANFAASPFAGRIVLARGDVTDPEFRETLRGPGGGFDVVVCNPPYYDARGPYADPAREKARCRAGLDAGALAAAAADLLAPGGAFFAVVPRAAREEYADAAARRGLFPAAVTDVSSARGRPPYVSLVSFRFGEGRAGSPVPVRSEWLCEADGTRGPFFAGLTRDLYLKPR